MDQKAIDPHSETVRPVPIVCAAIIYGRIIPRAVVIGHGGHLLIDFMIKVQIGAGLAIVQCN